MEGGVIMLERISASASRRATFRHLKGELPDWTLMSFKLTGKYLSHLGEHIKFIMHENIDPIIIYNW